MATETEKQRLVLIPVDASVLCEKSFHCEFLAEDDSKHQLLLLHAVSFFNSSILYLILYLILYFAVCCNSFRLDVSYSWNKIIKMDIND
jgi:hypothetical protein